MSTADRLRQAARALRGRPLAYSDALSDLVADWLEDIAADKDAGLGTIHPRAIDVTDLILGGDQ